MVVLHWVGNYKSKKRGEWVKMDFTSRSAPTSVAPSAAPSAPNPAVKKNQNRKEKGIWFRVGVSAIVAIIVILIIGVILLLGSTSNADNESKYVDTGKLQAVFLNTGQVYFGNIKALNNKYFVLQNIYYLQTSSSSSTTTTTSSASNVSLVKLGCELHQPYDQMVINRDEVTFWENLQSTGQVATAVAAFQKQNPNGQKCSDQSSSASTTSGTAAQAAGTSSTSTSTTGTSSTSGQ